VEFFLREGEELPNDLTNFYNMLRLISGWLPGKLGQKRIVVEAAIKNI
jgi:hypothetical protein